MGTELRAGKKYRVVNNAAGGHPLPVGHEFVARLVDTDNTVQEDGWWLWASELEEVPHPPLQTPSAPETLTTMSIPDTKATNPKDAIGSTKLGMDVVPDTAKVYMALAFTEGALKYGKFNWRVAGVRASIYKAALERHLAKYWNGEWADPKTGVPHLASVMACAAIILDANAAGKLTDDRPPALDISSIIDGLEPAVAHLKDLFKDFNPHHHTEADKIVTATESKSQA